MKTNAATAPTNTVTTPEPYSVAPVPPASPHMPSVHARALITWLAIFPLVAGGMALIAPFSEGWHPVLRAFALTLVVVPLAVYFVVPRLFQGYGLLRRRRMSK
ncbi:hypothetical protein [Arthrobacter rhizosphaerae]|uniref:hypothetical protein n=1 Tax=Arthrobacter rhizosphaerae TaxID=2855490 RepID=UPI001FF5D0FC|nr:hypothetical protein [Arthrobacter rhizosphaerae]